MRLGYLEMKLVVRRDIMSKASKTGSKPRPATLFLWPKFVLLSASALNPIISPAGGGEELLLRKATSLLWDIMTKSRE